MTQLKSKLASGELTIGCWVTLAHPVIPEILAPAGFDWLAVDMEHSSIELRDLLPLLIAMDKCNVPSLVRVGENDANLIKRVMDAGAHGVIVPNVNTAEQAQSAVSSVKYPPFGSRGVGLYRAQGFGEKFESYKQWLADESVVIVQVEHIEAVKNVDAILTTPGVDGFILGPYDLSASLGKPGNFDDPEVIEAIESAMAAARRHKIVAGFHSVPADPRQALHRYLQGARFLGFSLDTIFLGTAARTAMQELREQISAANR